MGLLKIFQTHNLFKKWPLKLRWISDKVFIYLCICVNGPRETA